MGTIAVIFMLLAVAIPTFVTQETAAEVSASKANLKQLVYAVESCAAVRVDGTYRGSDPEIGPDCLDPAVLVENESSLAQLVPTVTAPEPGGYQVAPIGDGSAGYLVQTAGELSSVDSPVWFAELHLPDGRILKLCDTEPLTAADTTGGNVDSEGCTDGTW